jgi:sulfofructose kinase
LARLATHIIASEHGAAILCGIDTAEGAATAIGRNYDGIVIVTAGERGCFHVPPGATQAIHTPAFQVEAVDTNAAGDVFHGAYALNAAEGRELEASLRFASAAAALKCARFGGRTACPTRSEVDEFLKGKA